MPMETGDVLQPKCEVTSGVEGNEPCVSGSKRARATYEEEQPSVRVVYNSLTRASKQKLDELLQQWSEWQGQQVPSPDDTNKLLESGERTVFPALCVGEEKKSTVSFWIDLPPKKRQCDEFVALNDNTVPLYDRGLGFRLTTGDGSSNLEGGLEIIHEAARCFNCGSYSHSLKDCTRPRDNVAVNNARKEKSKKNKHAASTRYYESLPAGKFDGLKPGALDPETRKLLGLGELDPPPWLNRMRELGYPPGYLDIDGDDDQHSRIMIFADGETKPENEELVEDGEIPGEPSRRKTVEFPGINAPIPENSDERLWTPGNSQSDYSSKHRVHHQSSYSSEQTTSRSYHSNDHNTRRSAHSREDHSTRRSPHSREDYSPSNNGLSGLPSRGIRESSHSYPSRRSFEHNMYEGIWGNDS
ncbi:hypothetical protein SAY87_011404 [Trapa incisa]|uniref:CCHC-type domain-containing protein n=1 Tax=Trapa incisa TaxID=236973 RepID=A0AAN7GZA0_9MYRT|nr:hypothetical protein SAY87_011404 [Trapa incisa]